MKIILLTLGALALLCNQLSYGHPLGEESRPELNAVEKLQAAIEADKPLVQVEAAQPKPDAQLAPQIVRAPQPEEPKPQSDAKPEASKPQADAKPQESKPQAVAQTKAEQPAFQTPAPQQEGGSAAKPQANLETVIYTESGGSKSPLASTQQSTEQQIATEPKPALRSESADGPTPSAQSPAESQSAKEPKIQTPVESSLLSSPQQAAVQQQQLASDSPQQPDSAQQQQQPQIVSEELAASLPKKQLPKIPSEAVPEPQQEAQPQLIVSAPVKSDASAPPAQVPAGPAQTPNEIQPIIQSTNQIAGQLEKQIPVRVVLADENSNQNVLPETIALIPQTVKAQESTQVSNIENAPTVVQLSNQVSKDIDDLVTNAQYYYNRPNKPLALPPASVVPAFPAADAHSVDGTTSSRERNIGLDLFGRPGASLTFGQDPHHHGGDYYNGDYNHHHHHGNEYRPGGYYPYYPQYYPAPVVPGYPSPYPYYPQYPQYPQYPRSA